MEYDEVIHLVFISSRLIKLSCKRDNGLLIGAFLKKSSFHLSDKHRSSALIPTELQKLYRSTLLKYIKFFDAMFFWGGNVRSGTTFLYYPFLSQTQSHLFLFIDTVDVKFHWGFISRLSHFFLSVSIGIMVIKIVLYICMITPKCIGSFFAFTSLNFLILVILFSLHVTKLNVCTTF